MFFLNPPLQTVSSCLHWAISNLTKCYSKKQETKDSLSFFKPIENNHGGFPKSDQNNFYLIFILIIKAYKKPPKWNIEEKAFIVNYQRSILNSKNERHQPKTIRAAVVQGGAEMSGGKVRRFPRNGLKGLHQQVRMIIVWLSKMWNKLQDLKLTLGTRPQPGFSNNSFSYNHNQYHTISFRYINTQYIWPKPICHQWWQEI